jgi:hypothetical protein
MARLLKNPDIAPGSLGVRLPIGSQSLSDAPVDGVVRFNSTNSKVEFYYNGAWSQIAKIGSVEITKDNFTTANGTAYYGPMSYSYTSGQEANVLVFVGGVQQVPGVNYDFTAGNAYVQITPSTGGYGQTITVLHNFNSTNAL